MEVELGSILGVDPITHKLLRLISIIRERIKRSRLLVLLRRMVMSDLDFRDYRNFN